MEITTKDLIIATREYREKMLKDPYRPTFHFAVPDDSGRPGDSNGAFYVDGVYHLMYLYKNSKSDAYHWGHISSVDLLHWRHHPDAIFSYKGDRGCYSGGAFVDDDKTAYLSFWKFPSKEKDGDNGGIAIAYAKPPYEKWERTEPVAIAGSHKKWGTVDIEIDGKITHISCADPSNIWKKNGFYYMQAGNKLVLDAYGRNEDSDPCYQGDWTDLFRSVDMKKWEFVHRFYINDHQKAGWPDITEDDMCPSFLPLYDAKENGNLTDKHLQLFISHNRGCQYYIGSLKEETFVPEKHGRMSWKDNTYFAPEALIDDRNRHIIWTWLHDNPEQDFQKYGWSGVFGFPRTVWLEDGNLKMAPAGELDNLEYNRQQPAISDDGSIPVNNGEVFRLKAVIDVSKQEKAGFSVRVDKNNGNRTDIYYDVRNEKLVFDASESGIDGSRIREEAPFSLDHDKEKLELDIFVDKSVVEVYANEKQAICRRVYPENPENAAGIELIGKRSAVEKLEIFDMAPTNPY